MTARSLLRTQYDLKLAARAYLPRILWLQGLPDQAMHAAESVVSDAAAAGQELALSLALVHAGCPISLWTGRFDAADRFIAMLSSRATAQGPGFWHAEARCYEAVLRVSRGQVASGLQLFGPALQEVLNADTRMNVTGYLAAMAGALADTAAAAEGRSLVAEALGQAGRCDDLWCMPELLRLEGVFVLQGRASDAAPRAEARLREALDLARRQGALSWELRAAISLAGLLRTERRLGEARAVLLSVRSRFSEGLETADLAKADGMAAELG
jgi:predicted ATPase